MKLAVPVAAFLVGLYFCGSHKHKDVVEPFETADQAQCADILVQKGNSLMLLNRGKARVPGVNPIYFNNLEEYADFLKWQRYAGIRCPVLYFRQTYDAQNRVGYRRFASPWDEKAGYPSHLAQARVPQYGSYTGAGLSPEAARMSGGLGVPQRKLHDASRDDPPYNKNMWPGFDGDNQRVGTYTPLDKLYHEGVVPGSNPMDVYWAGTKFARQLVAEGVYAGDSRAGQRPLASASRKGALEDEEWRRRERKLRRHKAREWRRERRWRDHERKEERREARRQDWEDRHPNYREDDQDKMPEYAGDRYDTASRDRAAGEGE